MKLLVLDEQLSGKRLVDGLRHRGLAVATVFDFGANEKVDPDVVRRIDDQHRRPWVLATMDVTIVEEHRGFDWDRYGIAWISPPQGVRGAAVEQKKIHILQRWAHEIIELGRGDHHTYYENRRAKTRPSLAAQLRKKL